MRGELVDELCALFQPAAYFVSPTGGNHEITRVYFHGGKYTCAYATSRVGELDVVGAHYDPLHGLEIVLSRGYRLYVPSGRVQASWKVQS